MKFLVVVCLLALVAADEDKNQDKKTQVGDSTSTPGLTQSTGSLLNSQVFPPFTSPVSNLAYTGFNGNISPIQGVNPDFFANAAAAAPAVVNGALSAFPVTRTILPGSSAIVNGIQSAFPIAGAVIPGLAQGIGSQFPGLNGVLQTVAGVPQQTLDANVANGGVSPGAFRFLSPEALTGIPTQGIQAGQNVGLSSVPTFTGGILPTINGVLQGQQGFPSGILKNPSGGSNSGISNTPGLTTGNSGSLGNVFRQP